MKPLHVGLLVIGAALAGGLAVKMAQMPSINSTPARRVQVAQAEAPPSPVRPDPPTSVAMDPEPVKAPPPVYEQPASVSSPVTRTHATGKPRSFTPRAPVVAPKPPARPVEIARVLPPEPAAPIPYQLPVSPEPVPVSIATPAQHDPAPPAKAAPQKVTLPSGMSLGVRLDQSVSSDHAFAGDNFQASLAEPLVVDGLVIAERGARVVGRVVTARKAGRAGGASLVELALSTLETADGQKVSVPTEIWSKQGESPATENAMKVGGGVALGAIIGALAGGGKGAAIGAGAGGGLGAGAVAATRPKPVDVPSETVIRFRLNARVVITERQL